MRTNMYMFVPVKSKLGFFLGRIWSTSLIASRIVSEADYPTSSPTKWDFKSERECPAKGARVSRLQKIPNTAIRSKM